MSWHENQYDSIMFSCEQTLTLFATRSVEERDKRTNVRRLIVFIYIKVLLDIIDKNYTLHEIHRKKSNKTTSSGIQK